MIKVAVLGYGTIGSGVVKSLEMNKEIITRHAGEEIGVKYVLDLREFPGDPVEKVLVHDFQTIVDDPEVAVVVEVMGGEHPAYEFCKAALEAGKQVCTSNKALVAAFGTDLIQTAKDHNVNFLFEASVGGGIPILRPLMRNLTVDDIYEITGILNGTTNYILTKMYDEGSAFEPTLKEAQDLGYAERNPEADIEGYDACRKIAILTSLAYGTFVDYKDIPTCGITGITAADIAYAKALGKKIKLFGTAGKTGSAVSCQVAPQMIGPENPLYAVDDVKNAILVRGNLLGDTMFYGSGAGSLPTASAVVSDIIDEVKHIGRNVPIEWAAGPMQLADPAESASRYFIRLDKSAAALAEQFPGAQQVSLPEYPDECALVTGEMTGKALSAITEGQAAVRSIIRYQ